MGEPDSTPDAEGPGETARDDEPVLRSTRLPPATAALRSALEDQRARTHELREALDDLRTTLEAGPGGLAPSSGTATPGPDRPRHPRRLLALLGAAAVVLAIGIPLLVAQRSSRTATGAPPSASGPAAASASASGASVTSGSSSTVSGGPAVSASASSSGAATPPATATTTAPVLTTHRMAWPGGPVLDPPGVATSGPGADAPGLELTAAIDPDKRHVDVYERIVLRPGTTSLHLAPASLGSVPRVLRGARPRVTDLQVELDGRAVRVVGGRTGWQAAAPSGAPIGHATLRYRLVGAFVRQTPAPPGRVTLILRPLGGGAVAASDDPAVVRLSDRRIGTVTCPTARRPMCAVTSGRTHTATIPLDASAIVLAQVNLH